MGESGACNFFFSAAEGLCESAPAVSRHSKAVFFELDEKLGSLKTKSKTLWLPKIF